MSNDLVTRVGSRPGPDPIHGPVAGAGGATSGRVPFADADEARGVVRSCRRLVARHVDRSRLADSMLVVVASKVLDEVSPDPGECRFVAVDGEPRVSASRFDALVRDTRRALVPPAARDDAELELPQLVAHELLRQLGSFSIIATAERPEGPEIVRALFAGAIASSTDPDDTSAAARSFAEALRLRTTAGPVPAASIRAVATALIGAAGPGPAASSTPTATTRGGVVVDLRDTPDRDPLDARTVRS